MQAKESDKKLFDHTDAASMNPNDYSQKLTGASNSQVGVGKSFKVYPGDKVRIEAWAKYYNPTSTTSNLTGFASMLLSAFGLSAPGGGETGTAAAGLNNWGAAVAGGGGHNDNGYPKGYVNIVLFDKNYNLLDIAYQQIDGGEQVGVSPKAAHDQMISEYTVKEEGYAYLFVSNESPTLVELYFDDVTFLHTKSNVIQYNEYYPFGMMAERTWTREGAKGNNYLHNGGTESNALTGLYDLDFRNYDPILGRMAQVDPMADKYGGLSTYNYSFNDPVYWNDPTGADPASEFWASLLRTAEAFINGGSESSGMSISMRSGRATNVGYVNEDDAVQSGLDHHSEFGTFGDFNVSTRANAANIDLQGRPDLGLVGNLIRNRAGSEFSKDLFENFWLRGGDVRLSQSRFLGIWEEIYETDPDAIEEGGRRGKKIVMENGVTVYAKVVDFCGSQEYSLALGRSTVFFDTNGTPVGFYDEYDFDPKEWGIRPNSAELKARMVNREAKLVGAQGFKFMYGVVPPRYLKH